MAERARDPVEFSKNPGSCSIIMTGFLLKFISAENLYFGPTRMCACVAEQRCSVGGGRISHEGLYMAVVVGTHELVKMLRLVADVVLVLVEHLATLVNS